MNTKADIGPLRCVWSLKIRSISSNLDKKFDSKVDHGVCMKQKGFSEERKAVSDIVEQENTEECPKKETAALTYNGV